MTQNDLSSQQSAGAPQGGSPFGPNGKVRGPFVVWLLTLVTFGIYGLVWYYKVNQELKDFDKTIDVNPGLAVVALFIPIVGLVSVYNTGSRIAQAQQNARGADSSNGIIGLLLCFLGGFHAIYYQAELNNLWRSRQA